MPSPDNDVYRELALTESELERLAVICQRWLDDHPSGLYVLRRVAHKIADHYAYSGSGTDSE
jgi:hypothetical protein